MFTYRDLVKADASVNTEALRHLVRRRAIAEYGAICPKSLREAMGWYRQHVESLVRARREELGLPVASAELAIVAGWRADGICREA